MPIFVDSGPIPAILGIFWILDFWIPGFWPLDFGGFGLGALILKAITSQASPPGVKIFKNDTPLDFKSKGGQDFQKK